MNLRKLISISALSVGLAFAPVSHSFAQDITDSHLAAARSAITSIEATDRFDEILPNVANSIKQQLIANNPDLEVQINEVVDEATIAMVSRRADLEVEAARAYAKAISEADLKVITEFYQSEAGKALLRNGAIISREVQAAAGVWQRGVERDLLANVSEKLAEVAPRAVEDRTDDASVPEATDAPAAE